MEPDRIPLGFKFKLRNTLQNFLVDDDMREVEFPDMILQQIDHIHNVIKHLTTESGYKVYAPLWEAMQIFSLKYIFKVSIHTFEDGERGNIIIEKIPRKKQENHEQNDNKTQNREIQSTDTEGDDDETSDSSQSPLGSPIHFLVPQTQESIQTTEHKNKKLTKEDIFVVQKNKIISRLTPAALEKLLQKILDFLLREEEGTLVFADLTSPEARFVENFLGIYNRRQYFRSSLSPACVALLNEIKKAFKQFDKLCKLEVTAKYNVHTKTREVIFLKAPRFTRKNSHQSLICNIRQKTPKTKSPKSIKSLTVVNSNFQVTNSVEDEESDNVEAHISIPTIEDKDLKNGEKEILSMTTEVPKENGEVKLHVHRPSIDNKNFMSAEKEKLSTTTKVSEDANDNNRKWSLHADFKEIVDFYASKPSLSDRKEDNELLDVVIKDSVEKKLSLDTKVPRVDTDNRAKSSSDATDDEADLELKLFMDTDVIKDNVTNADSFKENSINLGTINEKDAIDINDIEENDDKEEEFSMDGDKNDEEIQSNLKIAEDKLIVSNKALLEQEIVEIAVPKDKKSISPARKGCARIDKPSAINSERFRARPLCARRKQLLQAMSTPLESDKAMRMMRLMGWQGGALGPRGEGLMEPIIPALELVSRQGLGSNQSRTSSFTASASEKPRETKPTDKTIDKPQTTKPTRQFQEEPKKHTVITPIENRTDFLKTLLLVLKCEETSVSTITYKEALRKRDKRCYDNIVRMLNMRVDFSLSEDESAVLMNIQIIMAGAREVTLNTAYNTELTEIKITKAKGHDFINYSDEEQWQPSQGHNPKTYSDEEKWRSHKSALTKPLSEKTKRKPKIVTIKSFYKKNPFKRHICEKVLDFLKSENTKTVINFAASLTKKYCKIVGNVRNCINNRVMICYKNVRELFTEILDHAKLKAYVLDVEIGADLRSVILRKSVEKHQERQSINGEVLKHLINKYTDNKLLSIDKPNMKISNNNSEDKPNISNAQVSKIESTETLNNINNASTEEAICKQINSENDLNSYDTVSYTFIDSVNTSVIDDKTLIESDVFFTNEFSKCIKTRKRSVKSKGSKEQNIQKPMGNVLPLYVKDIVNGITNDYDDLRRIDKDLIKETIDSLCPHKENFEIELLNKENNNLLEDESLKYGKTSNINNKLHDFLEKTNTENSREWYKRSEKFLISEDQLEIDRESKMEPNNNNNGNPLNSPTFIKDCVDSQVNNATVFLNNSIEALKNDSKIANNRNTETVDATESKTSIESIEKCLAMNPLREYEVLIGNQDCLDVVESKELINLDDERTKLDKLQTGAGTSKDSIFTSVKQASNYNKDSDIINLNQTNEISFELSKIETEENNDEDFCDNKDILDINKSRECNLVAESCAKMNDTNKENLCSQGSDKSEEFVDSDRDFKVDNIEVVKDPKDNLGHVSECGSKDTNIFNESDLIDLRIKLEAISKVMEERIQSIVTKHLDGTEPNQNDELVEIESELEEDLPCVGGNANKSCTDLNQICTKHSKLEPIKANESQKSVENDSQLKTFEAEANLEQNITHNYSKVQDYEEIIETNYKLDIIQANNEEEDYSFKTNGRKDLSKDPLKTDSHQDLMCTTANENVRKNNTDDLNIDNKLDLRQENEKVDDKYARNIDNFQHIVLIESNFLSVETIQKKIQDLIGNISKSEFLPLLKYHGVLDTGIVYGYHNRDTYLWLKRVFPECSIVDYKCAIDNHKLKIKVTSLNEDSKSFFYLLELYNKGSKCQNWRVVSEKHYNYYLQIFVEMDSVSFEFVCDNNFSLSVGYDVAQFSIGW